MATTADLGRQVKAKYPGQYDDLDDASLGAKVKGKYPGSYDDFQDDAQGVQQAAAPGFGQQFAQGAVENLPGILAGITGALGGVATGGPTLGLAAAPGAIGGAALGGAVGVPIRDALRPLVGTEAPKSDVLAPTKEGILQGLLEAPGLFGAGAAARIGGAMTGKALRAAAAKTETAVAKATQAGIRYDPLEIVKDFAPLHREISELDPSAAERLGKFVNRFMRNKEGPQTPSRLLKIRQLADRESQKLHDLNRRGLPAPPGMENRVRFLKLAADNAREMLRRIPGVEVLDKGTARAIKDRRMVPVAPTGPIRASLGNAMGATDLIQRGVTNKPVIEGIGEMLSNPAFLQLLRQLPRGVGGLLDLNQ